MNSSCSVETHSLADELLPLLLACRKKLAKKTEELESLQKECDRRSTLLGSITAEKEKLAAALAATQAKLRRVSQEASAAAAEPAL
jgi:peptidoglycan hydrolase CwlO-like protein